MTGAGTHEIDSKPATTHPGCRVLFVEEYVGEVLVRTELTTNPRTQGYQNASDELLDKHATAIAKAKWRQE